VTNDSQLLHHRKRPAPIVLSRRLLIGGAAALASTPVRAAEPVQIYAAMTFRAALDAVLAADAGAATAVYGPTPVLVRQLEAGAPADILLTADPGWMDDAARRGLIRTASRTVLMRNDLVLAGPASAAPVEIGPGFPILDRLNGGRLAMCDPDHDPAGRYARQSLESLGLWEAVAPRLAIAENSLAAVTLLDRGEVFAAACFATDLHGDPRSKILGRFPETSHAPILYPVALTTRTENPHAPEILAFLLSPPARAIFESFGYRPP